MLGDHWVMYLAARARLFDPWTVLGEVGHVLLPGLDHSFGILAVLSGAWLVFLDAHDFSLRARGSFR